MSTGSEKIKLAFVGDICLGTSLPKTIASHGERTVFEAVAPSLQEADIRVGNLECCVVDGSCPDSVHSHPMAVPAETARLLTPDLFNVFNLANNHMLDCGPESITATRQFLQDQRITYFGAGANLEEASEIGYVVVSGKTIAFLGFCDSSRYYADANQAGIAPIDPSLIERRIKEAQKEADLTIVLLHGDLEFTNYPAPWRVKVSRSIARQGADLVIEHHPHVLQGMEMVDNSLIAYSLGNFVFGWYGDSYMGHRPGVNESVILQVTADFSNKQPSLSWNTLPVKIDHHGRPQPLSGQEADCLHDRIHRLSESLQDNSRVRAEWFKRCRQEVAYQLNHLYWQFRDHGPGAFFTALGRLIKTPEHRRWLAGFLSIGHL